MNLVFLKRNRLWLKTFVWIFFAMFFSINGLTGQDIFDEKFEQIDGKLPTPNSYRTGAGAPGPAYWQQRADYEIAVILNDEDQSITGNEIITYYNNSPSTLNFLWIQLDQNIRAKDSDKYKINERFYAGYSVDAKRLPHLTFDADFDGGFRIISIEDIEGNGLSFHRVKTMMRIDLAEPLKPGSVVKFQIDWNYLIGNRRDDDERSGYEYFPKDDNYLYAIAQFYPRMAVFDDFNGWQNKQFLGQGEFTLNFGNFDVKITAPADHVIAATGSLENESLVLNSIQLERLQSARASFDAPVVIITEEEAVLNEGSRSDQTKTWHYKADNVRDFAWVSSRKFIWDAQAVQLDQKTTMAMSLYPKEGNPLWEQESTKAVVNTLKTYSEMTIEYPYPVAISVHTAAIGMEYPMICFNYGRPDKKGDYSSMTKWSMISVIIHEVGHNFFPMIINSDERQWSWMDEGLNTFLETKTSMEWYPEMPIQLGTPATIKDFMSGEKDFMRPIMTNSENILFFGNNAYSKPSAALFLLRETIMGPELFDYSFKEYARRWAFKHPKPADFFRTMEDASAIDLDWFWRGWFYTTDHVDINLQGVSWYVLSEPVSKFQSKYKSTYVDGTKLTDFQATPQPWYVFKDKKGLIDDYLHPVNQDAVMEKFIGKNAYELFFRNDGGLISPIIIKWIYEDGTSEIEQIPAEIWRINELNVSKVFIKEKVVSQIILDPLDQTADVNFQNNYFPKTKVPSKFDRFKTKVNK
ncbi:M1 family metallopeptidase [Cyclobacteriaceae bacterium]|nr:M1 family metallopeptidase [Cyclobacteriaceae bacterium]MDB4316188.1 M1 family metallopeptidase [Cyclobacteriaceae bacterium]